METFPALAKENSIIIRVCRRQMDEMERKLVKRDNDYEMEDKKF